METSRAENEKWKKTYNCKFTGGQKKCNVVLPPNYDPSKKYPVMYVLHGIGGDENSMVSGMGVQELLAGLIGNGKAEEMIIVLPSQFTSKNGSQGGGFGINLETCAAYDNFLYDISDSLIPFIEANYPVKTGRENRAITGFSMGGREAIYIGLMRPDLFAYVGGACPAPGITPGSDMFMEVIAQILETTIDNVGPLSLEATNPCDINSTCVVFAQSEVISLVARKYDRRDILAGMHISMARRIVKMMKKSEKDGDILMTGGGSLNIGLHKAFEEELMRDFFVADYPQFNGAIGAALIVSERG